MHLLRGLSVGLDVNYSCAEEWRPLAEEALYFSGRLKGWLYWKSLMHVVHDILGLM